jgi:hypothetical protein
LALGIVRGETGKAGKTTLTVTADNLASATVQIETMPIP